jgi:hypothetical protein
VAATKRPVKELKLSVALELEFLPSLKRLFKRNRIPYDWRTCAEAAKFGHLDVLKWLVFDAGFPFTTSACENAARNGHLQVLHWLIECGCQSNE